MNNPGIKDLGTRTITAALTDEVITLLSDGAGNAREYVGDLEGLSAIDVQFKFDNAIGGSTLKAWLQTSLDQGATWSDLWCFAATTSPKTRQRTLVPNNTENTPTDGSLADNTVATGIVFGDRFRVKVTSTGTYSGNSNLSVRMNAR